MATGYMRCNRCDRYLNSEEPRFIVSIHVTVDAASEHALLDAVVSYPIPLSLEEVSDWVCKEMAFILCSDCREHFAHNPFGLQNDLPPLGLVN